MMQLGEKLGGEGGEVATKQQQQQQQQAGKDVVAAAGGNSKQLKRSLNAGDQLVPGALPKPTTPLPCPRCESLNTKFCYYNNYSVTQPRHFCRQCQRYWTAGGTLRNVPVGGGSRKKSRHSQRAPDNHHQHPQHHHHHQPPAYMVPGSSFMQQQQQQQQPGMNPMSGVMPGGVGFPPLGFQHLMQPAAPDMTGFSFGMQTGGGSMYGAVAGDPGNAMPLQMRPAAAGGENSLHLNPPPPQYPAAPPPKQPELVENNNVDHVVGVKITKNGSSSSTIEEEGSTPTNGYSHSGYNEEGDAVSSMWHEMHDMDNVLFQ